MALYARIDNGKVAEFFETGDDITTLFNPALIWSDVTGLVPPPQEGWIATDNNGIWSFSEEPVNSAALWKDYQRDAQSLLDKSDITILRCVENNVAVPSSWATYRANLRTIVSSKTGDPSVALPLHPAYPAGT